MRRFGWVVVACAVLVVLLAALAVGTSAGTRLAVAAAAPLLPPGLAVEGLEGSILGGIRATRIRWTDAGSSVDLSEFRGSVRFGRLLSGSLSVDLEAAVAQARLGDESAEAAPVRWVVPLEVTARIGDLRLHADGSERTLGATDFSVAVGAREMRLAHWHTANPTWRLAAHGRMGLAPPYEMQAEATWHAQPGAGATWSGKLEVAGDHAAYRVRHRLQAPVEVVTDGRLSRARDLWSFKLSSTWEELTDEVFGATVQLAGGRVDLAGALAGDGLEVTASMHLGPLGPAVIEPGAAVTISAGHGPATLSATTSMRWSPVVHSTTDLRLEGLQTTVHEAGLRFLLAADAKVQGEWLETGPRIAVDVGSLRGVLNGRPYQGQAAASIRSGAINDLEASLSMGRNRATLAGSLDEHADLRIEVDAPALQDASPLLRGGMAATLEVVGPPANPRFTLEATGSKLGWGEFAADRAELVVDGYGDAHRVRIAADGPAWAVSGAMRNRRDTGGWLGSIDNLMLSGRFGAWSLDESAEVSVDANGFAAAEICLSEDEGGKVCTTLAGRSAEDAEVALKAGGISLRPWLDGTGVTLLGTVAANARFVARAGAVDGAFEAHLEDPGTVDADLLQGTLQRAELRGTVSGNRLEAVASAAANPGRLESRVVLDDILDSQAPVSGMLELDVDDIAAVATLIPGLANPRGRIVGLVDVAGSLAMPAFEGSLRLHDGRADIRRPASRPRTCSWKSFLRGMGCWH